MKINIIDQQIGTSGGKSCFIGEFHIQDLVLSSDQLDRNRIKDIVLDLLIEEYSTYSINKEDSDIYDTNVNGKWQGDKVNCVAKGTFFLRVEFN